MCQQEVLMCYQNADIAAAVTCSNSLSTFSMLHLYKCLRDAPNVKAMMPSAAMALKIFAAVVPASE